MMIQIQKVFLLFRKVKYQKKAKF